MKYKLVPLEPTPEMLCAGHAMTLPASIWYAMLEAVPAAPVELEPVGEIDNLGPAKYCVKFVTIPPALGTKLYAIPLDAAAVIAEKDAEIAELQQDLQTDADALGHAYLELAVKQQQINAFYSGNPKGGIVAGLQEQLAAAEKQRDELLAALEGFVEWALDETIPTREAMIPALAAIAKVKGEKHENL